MTEIDHSTELILGTAQFQSGYGVVRDTEQAHQSDGVDILELAARLGIAARHSASIRPGRRHNRPVKVRPAGAHQAQPEAKPSGIPIAIATRSAARLRRRALHP